MKTKKHEKYDEFLQYLNKILWFTFYYTFGSTVLVYLGSLYFTRLPNDDPVRSLFVGEIDTWIIFFGTVLGGSLTVFGVLFTIIFNMKIRKREDLEKKKNEITKNRPYIICEKLNLTVGEFHTIQGTLIFKNLSINPARNLNLVDDKSYVNFSNIDNSTDVNFKVQSIQFLGDNISQEVFFHIDFPLIESKEPVHTHMHFEFKYYDLSGENSFSHSVLLDGTIEIYKFNKKTLKLSYDNSNFNITNDFNWSI